MKLQINKPQVVLASLPNVHMDINNEPESETKIMHLIALFISALLIAILYSNPASAAAPVKDSEAANLLAQCLLADDNRLPPLKNPDSTKYGKAKCCSKSLGFCIYCSGREGKECIKTKALSSVISGFNKIPLSAPTTLAPKPLPSSTKPPVMKPLIAPNNKTEVISPKGVIHRKDFSSKKSFRSAMNASVRRNTRGPVAPSNAKCKKVKGGLYKCKWAGKKYYCNSEKKNCTVVLKRTSK